MARNMSNLDRGLRSFLVAPAAIVLLALAAIMLATSAIGFCPLYTLLHLDTRGRRPLPH